MRGPVMRGVMRSWRRKLMLRAPVVPHPLDEPAIRPEGDDPDLVLIVGNGTAHGWGVTTHQLALPGQLSREMQRITGRPCAVRYIGDDRMDIASAPEWLGDRDLSAFDAAVVIFGVSDAVQLTPERQWEASLSRLLDVLRERSKFAAQFLVVGIQPLRSIITLDSVLGGIAGRHAERLNAITRSVAEKSDDTGFFPLGPAEFQDGQPFGSAAVYRARAAEIAERLAPVVDAVRTMEGDARKPTRLA